MKKIIVLVVGLLMFSIAGYSQKTELKGPKAKNTKPWKNKREKTTIVLFGGKKDKKVGPKAKNEREKAAEKQVEAPQSDVIEPSKKGRRSGPKGKNKKPGRN